MQGPSGAGGEIHGLLDGAAVQARVGEGEPAFGVGGSGAEGGGVEGSGDEGAAEAGRRQETGRLRTGS